MKEAGLMNGVSNSRMSIFGPFCLEAGHVRCETEEIRLSPKELLVLEALVHASGGIVMIDELLDQAWGFADIGRSSLNRCISTLRQKLCAFTSDPVIETYARRGYRLGLPVRHFHRSGEGALFSLEGTPHKAAFEMLLQSFQLMGRRSEPELRAALARLEMAVAADPHYLPALIAIADMHVTLAMRRHDLPRVAGQRALEIVSSALRRRPEAAPLLAVRGFVRAVIEGEEEGVRDLDAAVRIGPDAWLTRFYRAWALTGLGDSKTVVADIDTALRLSPMNPGLIGGAGYMLFCIGRAGRALDLLRQGAIDLPLTDTVQASLCAILAHRDDHDAAIEAGRRVAADSRGSPSLATTLVHALLRARRTDEARELLAELTAGEGPGLAPSLLIPVYLELGQRDLAEAAREQAERDGCTYRHIIPRDPRVSGYGWRHNRSSTINLIPSVKR